MSTYKQNPELPVTLVAGEAAIITPVDSRLHILNDVATRIWEHCADDGCTLEALVEALRAEFEVDAETARTEARAFLDDGVARGVLIIVD